MHRQDDADGEAGYRDERRGPKSQLVDLTRRFGELEGRYEDLPGSPQSKERGVTNAGEERRDCRTGAAFHQAEPLQGLRR